MARTGSSGNGDTARFKHAIDKQNRLERAEDEASRQRRDAAEGEAARAGIPALEKHSKGRPKQKDDVTAKKSPQTARAQSR